MDTSTNLLPSTGQPAARYPVILPPAAGQNPIAFVTPNANLPNHMAFGPLAPQNPMAYAYAPPATYNPLPYAPPAQHQVPYSTPVANPTPATTINSSKSTNLPTYPQMIAGAITDLKAKNGSSRQTITRHIGNRYPDLLPENYSAMVGKYLKQMKEDGSLDMVKHSYMLRDPRSVAPPSPDPNLSAGPPKRGRGRPLKPKPIAVVQPEREPVLSLRLAESPVMCNSPQEVVDGTASTLVKRRPGRPRKVKDASVGSDEASGSILGKRSRGRPPAQPKPLPAPTAEAVVKRKRGRPARTEPPSVFKPRPRGRPRKNAASGGVKPVGRRGRLLKNVVLLDGAGGVLPAKRAVGSKAKEPRERKRLGRPPKKVNHLCVLSSSVLSFLIHYTMCIKRVINT
ncbi:hypothetical protein RJ639_037418 [Escallonia herrerae]|uniref:H15 domain-containing protein n=1 Tax=Escallonia herrerae TaxID=1293975 RepID=A0AA89B713_9ASTE|nr:hypothetical protein RJ639_037418 [Escallonia herrerae]